MKEVACHLNVTPRTVAFHKYVMMEQLEVRSSAELIQYPMKSSIVGGVNTLSVLTVFLLVRFT